MISISAITFLKEKKLYEKFLKWQKDKQKDTYAQRKAYYKEYNTKRKLAKQQDEINRISAIAEEKRKALNS